MTELPGSWTVAEIAALVEPQANGRPFQQGWSPQCENRPADDEEWGVVKTTAVQHGEFLPHENKALPDKLDPRPQIEIKPGDVLMTCAGPRKRCGVACLVEHTKRRLMMSGKMYRFRPHPKLLVAHFLSHFIRLHSTQLRIDEMKTGINDSGLNLTHSRFGQLPVVVPPLNEQRRIVERIEVLFDEIDRGVESLRTAKSGIARYRQSLLKSAFEGRLTADWRTRNPDKLESPDAPLNQDHGWTKVTLSEVCAINPRVDKSTLDDDGFVAFVPMSAVEAETGRIDVSQTRSFHSVRKGYTSFKEGDVLFSKITPCMENGKMAVVPRLVSDYGFGSTEFHVLRAGERIDPRFLYHAVSNQEFRYHAERQMKGAVGQKRVPVSILTQHEIALPSVEEQHRIIEILDACFGVAETLEAEVDAGLARAEALRQSILKQAFAGRLVPQDPGDEPATALLARIRADRAKAPATRRKKRSKA